MSGVMSGTEAMNGKWSAISPARQDAMRRRFAALFAADLLAEPPAPPETGTRPPRFDELYEAASNPSAPVAGRIAGALAADPDLRAEFEALLEACAVCWLPVAAAAAGEEGLDRREAGGFRIHACPSAAGSASRWSVPGSGSEDEGVRRAYGFGGRAPCGNHPFHVGVMKMRHHPFTARPVARRPFLPGRAGCPLFPFPPDRAGLLFLAAVLMVASVHAGEEISTLAGEEIGRAALIGRLVPVTGEDQRSVDLTVPFARGSADLTAKAQRQLTELAHALAGERLQGFEIGVYGHTDASGPADYNRTLSEARAAAVVRYLTERFALDAARFRHAGHGEDRLLDGIDPSSPRHRRVEIVVFAPESRQAQQEDGHEEDEDDGEGGEPGGAGLQAID